MSLTIVSFAGLLIGATSLFMAALMFSLSKNWQNVIWGLFCLAVFDWGLPFFFIPSATTAADALFWWRVSHVGVILIPLLFLQFVYIFTRRTNFWILGGSYLLGAIFLMADVYSDALVSVQMTPWGFYFNHGGPLYPTLFAFFVILISYGHYLLWKAYRRSVDPRQRQQIKLFFIATVIGFLGGSVSFAPVFEIYIYPTAILTVPLYPVIMGYAILRYRLFNLGLVTAQLMALLIFLVTFINLFFSQTYQAYLLNGGSFILSLVLGTYLIRSVMREVEQREEIEQLSNQKSEFMSFASHEIRNPITAMRGFASLIADGTAGAASPEVKEVGKKILVEGNEVLSLISQFLSKSKLELGQLAYAHEPFDMGAVVSQTVDGFMPHAEERGLFLKKNIDLSREFKVQGDHGKVREVVGNLIDNSLKYTQKGGVTVTVEQIGNNVRAEVADTGVGLPEETIQHLFKKFSRADAQKMNLMGTGLGLYLGKTFIEAQGGKIWAESDGAGKGSRFIIEFPAA